MGKSSRSKSKKKSHSTVRKSEKFRKKYKEKLEKILSTGTGPNMLVQEAAPMNYTFKRDHYNFERDNFLRKDLKKLKTKNIKEVLKHVPEWDKNRLSRQIKKRRKVKKPKFVRIC
ncbi:hypothetical protein HZS_8086 [Henneguya salminicola]|nr:hypothetical protein HZS_8086 [Henneguya salminicola]